MDMHFCFVFIHILNLSAMRKLITCCLLGVSLGLLAQTPYKGRILKVYEAIAERDMPNAERLMETIAKGDTQPYYPVFELASCYLALDSTTSAYAPLMAYRTLRKVESLGQRIEEAEAFLSGYGLSMGSLRGSIERCLVDDAVRENSLQGWDRFLLNIDNDSLKAMAEAERRCLAYEGLLREPYVDRCEAFLDRYPSGRFVAEVTELRDRLLYESIGDNLRQLERFIQEHPSSPYAELARKRLDQIYAPELSSGQALSLAATLFAPDRVIEAFPFANRDEGTDQFIAVVERDGLLIAQCKPTEILFSLQVPATQNDALDRYRVDKVEKVVVGGELMYLVVYRYFTYSRECADCVERGYALYEPAARQLDSVVLSGFDLYSLDGTLERIEGMWLPCAANARTGWLKDYARKELGDTFKE